MGVAYSVGEVDHLYTFFVEWSPDIYTKGKRNPSFFVVDDDRLAVIDKLLKNNPKDKPWEIITAKDHQRRQSLCSSEGYETEDLLPELREPSQVLQDHHLDRLVGHLPARTQGYPWRLVYSTTVHGTSLQTLYRNMSNIDRPVLLAIKDMEDQVFGAFSSHPFRVSTGCYGTGETFLYSFSPDFNLFSWTGKNSYFVKGFMDSLQLGGGGGRFGLWLDAGLCRGSSYTCHTFHNQPLSAHHDFAVKELEVWTFE